MKSVIVFCAIMFCAIILRTGQAAAVIKDCGELKSEIAAKLDAAGISPSVLAVVDKDWAGAGKIVGSCENGTKRIVRIPAAGPVSGDGQADIPSRPSVTFAYGIKDCEELKSEIAAKLAAAGVSSFFLAIVDKDRKGAGKILGSCENGTKRIVRAPVVDSASGIEQAYVKRWPADAPSVSLAYGIKDCGELKSEIAAKLVAAGVSSFHLAIVDKDRTGGGKIVGSCENGTKRIIRRK